MIYFLAYYWKISSSGNLYIIFNIYIYLILFFWIVRLGVLSWKRGTHRAGWVARRWELGACGARWWGAAAGFTQIGMGARGWELAGMRGWERGRMGAGVVACKAGRPTRGWEVGAPALPLHTGRRNRGWAVHGGAPGPDIEIAEAWQRHHQTPLGPDARRHRAPAESAEEHTERAPGRNAGPRHKNERRALTQSAEPRHKERRPRHRARAPTQPDPDTERWAPTQRRSAGPRHKAPDPDTKSAGPRHKERQKERRERRGGPDTNRDRKRRGPNRGPLFQY